MAEQRLIDAEALKEKVKSFCGETMARGFGKTTLSMAWELIGMFVDEIPTAEAKPIVHAHWKHHMQCSECGQVDTTEPNFCPNCGAQMDEKED